MLSENKTVQKNAEYPNNRIDRCGISDSKSDTSVSYTHLTLPTKLEV